MKHGETIAEVLKRGLRSASHDSKEHVDAVGNRVFQRVLSRAAIAEANNESAQTVVPVPRFRLLRAAMASAAAGLLLAIVIVTSRQTQEFAAVENADGSDASLRLGEIVRAAGPGTTVVLADGSRIEMRSGTELRLEQAGDGVRIRLNKGGVIVDAAKLRQGHLYVQTRDLTVSVMGTVFLVNVEEEGSRVAVIEGEVRVQHGAAERKLQPGEQVATGPSMEPQPVKEGISWSRNAEEHMALLQETVNPPTAPKAGSVTGVVRTSDGSAASGIRVTAMRSDSSDAALRAMASLTETDASGHYRLENVPAGDYYIALGRVDSPIFYPGTLEISKGSVVSITSAATVTHIDFVIEDVRLVLPPTRASRSLATSMQTLRNMTLSKANTVRTTRTESGSDLSTRTSPENAAWWTDQTLVERLGLVEDQKKRVAEIIERYKQGFVQNQTATEKETAKSKMEAEILSILTEAQRLQVQTEASQPAAGNTTRSGARLSRAAASGVSAPAGPAITTNDK